MEPRAGLVEIRTVTMARLGDESGCGQKAWQPYFKEVEERGAKGQR